MNATEVHWILEQARKVLRPSEYDELVAALRDAGVPRGTTGRAEHGIPVSSGPSGQPLTEAENREAFGK